MPLAREVPDFTAVARSSLFEAIAIEPEPCELAGLCHGTPRQVFIARLSCGSSLRRAARGAGLNRPQAKDVLRLVSRAAAERHADVFGRLRLDASHYRAAWAFAEKQRNRPPSRLDREDPHSVWTHVWIDDAIGLLRHWMVGPSPSILDSANDPGSIAEHSTLRGWIGAGSSGFKRKIELHAQAVTFFATHHNFCRIGAQGMTPAMLARVTDRQWTERDMASLAFGIDAEGAA